VTRPIVHRTGVRGGVSVAVLAAVVSGFGSAAAAQTASGDLDARIVKLVASVSEERLGAIEKKLESFETRSSLSSTTSPTRGIGAAPLAFAAPCPPGRATLS